MLLRPDYERWQTGEEEPLPLLSHPTYVRPALYQALLWVAILIVIGSARFCQ